MALSIIKTFSILVASGNGQKCNSLKSKLHHEILATDDETGMSKLYLHKFCRKAPGMAEHHRRIALEVGDIVKEALDGVPGYFYGPDLSVDLQRKN